MIRNKSIIYVIVNLKVIVYGLKIKYSSYSWADPVTEPGDIRGSNCTNSLAEKIIMLMFYNSCTNL